VFGLWRVGLVFGVLLMRMVVVVEVEVVEAKVVGIVVVPCLMVVLVEERCY
jgi:hypothetical protein